MTTRPAESRRRLRRLVSPYTGLVRRVEPTMALPDDTRLRQVFGEVADTTELVGYELGTGGAGAAADPDAAFAAAVGEAVERYSALYSDEADPVIAAATELGAEAVDPARFALFAAAQHADASFPFERFTSETRVSWIRARSLPDGEPALVPAQLVYLAWPLRPGEARIGSATSSGLACHATFEEAVLNGLLELLERDAFMITWAARLSLPRLEWEGDAQLERFARRYLAGTGLSFAALDLSAFWEVPVALGVARSHAPGEAPLGVGAGCAATPQQAVAKALDEAFRVRSWARAVRLDGIAPAAEEIRTFEQHVAFYAHEENAGRAAFLDSSARTRHVSDVPRLEGDRVRDRIDAVCRRLRERGSSAYAVDVTAPDVRAAGLRVVKVVAPELCPLDADHHSRFLGGRRLYEAALELGLRSAPLAFEELNPDPHPFP